MELVLASNFDNALVEGIEGLPVTSLFGNYPVSLTGGGRPPQILPQITPEQFREHVNAVHRSGRTFYATINSNDLDLQEYTPGFLYRFDREVDDLLDLGVDGFVVALPLLVEAIKRAHPSVPVSVSTFARIRSVTQAEYFQRMGADTVVIEESNRDFDLLKGLVALGLRVEVLVNQTCIPDCPYRAHHLATSSLASQYGRDAPSFEYPILECGLELVRDPTKLISGIFVRPEDLEVYEEVGVRRFKVSGRNHATDWLLRAARAYAARHYEGDLMDILSYVQVRGPRRALEAAERRGESIDGITEMRAAFAPLVDLHIDNDAFPLGFLRKVASTDCRNTTCTECRYCAGVAEKVMRINGKPPSEYVAPRSLPAASQMLPAFAPRGEPWSPPTRPGPAGPRPPRHAKAPPRARRAPARRG
jgi:collagenase-like PrtC family protease